MTMLNHISIDVTDAKECAVPKDKFRINNYTFIPGLRLRTWYITQLHTSTFRFCVRRMMNNKIKPLLTSRSITSNTSPLPTARRFCFTWAQPKRLISRAAWFLWR